MCTVQPTKTNLVVGEIKLRVGVGFQMKSQRSLYFVKKSLGNVVYSICMSLNFIITFSRKQTGWSEQKMSKINVVKVFSCDENSL